VKYMNGKSYKKWRVIKFFFEDSCAFPESWKIILLEKWFIISFSDSFSSHAGQFCKLIVTIFGKSVLLLLNVMV
jgi:hypothetical protein